MSMRACGRPAATIIEQGQTTCCYAKSEKSWIDDPAGISWETFLHHRREHGLRRRQRRERRAVAHAQGLLRAARPRRADAKRIRLLRRG